MSEEYKPGGCAIVGGILLLGVALVFVVALFPAGFIPGAFFGGMGLFLLTRSRYI